MSDDWQAEILPDFMAGQVVSPSVPPPSVPVVEVNPEEVTLRVPGWARPQGSKQPRVTRTGKMYVKESGGKNLRDWRTTVIQYAEDAMRGRDRIEGPVALELAFTFERPAVHYGTGKNANRLKDSAPEHVTSGSIGDLDKLLRAIFDALTQGGVMKDDRQVVEIVHLRKLWGTASATEIRVWPL